jgi:hypothetical protein
VDSTDDLLQVRIADMERADCHTSEETPAPEARGEPGNEAYEPPSVTELGSYVQLTAGGSGQPTDTDSTSFTL